MSGGFSLNCPVCARLILPDVASLHLLLAPRLAHHLWDRHAFETRILLLHLLNPPAEWPELIEGDEAITEAFGREVAA